MKLAAVAVVAAAAAAQAAAGAPELRVAQAATWMRERFTRASERRGLQSTEEVEACLVALGIPESVFGCFFDSAEGDDLALGSDSVGNATEDAFTSLLLGVEQPTVEVCEAAFSTRATQCTVRVAGLDGASGLVGQLLTLNATNTPEACQSLDLETDKEDEAEPGDGEDGEDAIDEGDDCENDSIGNVGATVIVALLKDAGAKCEAVAPGVTTSLLGDDSGDEGSGTTALQSAVALGALALALAR